jgi:hypothetical protein
VLTTRARANRAAGVARGGDEEGALGPQAREESQAARWPHLYRGRTVVATDCRPSRISIACKTERGEAERQRRPRLAAPGKSEAHPRHSAAASR